MEEIMKRETTKRLTAMGMSVAMAAGLFTTIGTTAVWAEDSAPKATAADNGILKLASNGIGLTSPNPFEASFMAMFIQQSS